MRRAAGAALAASVALGAAACGGDDDEGGSGSAGEPRLLVAAAASMTEALEACSPRFEGADVRLSFAGSDELAAQIRRGVKPDVYAAANTELPEELNREGLLGEPVELVTNTLVVAVRKGSEIGSLGDLAKDGVTLAIGAESAPIGSYTREALRRLPAGEADAILANVRSSEPDAKGIVGKLTQGAVDAGFAYESDVNAAGGELRAIPLPGRLQPTVVYAAGVVKGARQPEIARRYLDGLVGGTCHAALRAAGFGPLK